MYKAKLASRAVAGLVAISLLMTVGVTYSAAQPVTATNNPPGPSQPAVKSGAQSAVKSGAQPAYTNVQWSDAQNVSGGSGELYPGLAMNGGEAQINFKGGSPQEIFESYSTDNGHTWSGPRYRGCDGGAVAGSTAPSIAEDIHLNVYMVWEDYCGSTRQLYFKKYDVITNQWLATRQIVSSNTNGGSVAVGADGVIHISFINVFASGSSGQVEYIYSTNGGNNFSSPTVLSDSKTWVVTTHVAVDTLNRPHIVYDKGPSGRYSIIASDLINGAWHATSIYSGRGFWPKIAADHNGGVGAVWQMNDAGVQILYSHFDGTSQQWDGVPTQISVDSSNNYYPALTYDNLDDAYVVWGQSDSSPGSQHLQFSYEYSPGVWSPEINLQGTRTSVPVLANYNNNLTLAYQFDGTGNWGIWSSWAQLSQQTNTPTNTPTNTYTPTPTNTPTNTPTFTPTFTPTPCADGSLFADVCQGYWAYPYIQALGLRGIVSGQGGYYYPGRLITRAELTAIMVRSQSWSLITPPTPSFSDVPISYFAYSYIETALAHHAISGYTDNISSHPCADAGVGSPCFLPNNYVKRDETTVIIVRASGFPLITPPNPSFTDVPTTYWAYSAIETAHARGIVSGVGGGLFRPGDHAKRDQMAKIVYLALPAITSIVPSSAQAGSNTLVTITGRNFGDPQTISSTLQVNGITMTIVSWHDTVINFTIPANTPSTPSPATINLTWNNKLAFIENNTTFTVLPAPTATPGPPTSTPGGPTNTPLPTVTSTATATVTPGGPTNTPLPTVTSTATVTPGGPTNTPVATNTPLPTTTATATLAAEPNK